jgi:transcriptional regulator with XRE-family HTH domain
VPRGNAKVTPATGATGLADEITLAGRRVLVNCIDLPLDKVSLDPSNPRVANQVRMGQFSDGAQLQKELADMLWKDPDVHSALYHSVRQNGGLIERIIVRGNGVVAEGNCRTLVYQRLRELLPNEPAWQKIPARVLPDDVTDKEVAILLGELHVGGKNEWSPFEKAGHMFNLRERHGMTQDEIAKLLRTSKGSVNHGIRAFKVMNDKFLPAYGGVGAVRKYSYFVELFKDPDLREWLERDRSALDDFVNWVGIEKINRGADVRELADFVKSESALQAFREQGYEAAKKILELDQPALTVPLFKQMNEMAAALNGATLADIQRVRRDKVGNAKQLVRDLRDSLDRFVDLCDGI